MGCNELEAIIEDKIVKGEMSCGLYDTGFCFVYVFLTGDLVRFKWFERVAKIDNYID